MGDWNCPRQQIALGWGTGGAGVECRQFPPTEGEYGADGMWILIRRYACVSGTSGWADIEGTEGF